MDSVHLKRFYDHDKLCLALLDKTGGRCKLTVSSALSCCPRRIAPPLQEANQSADHLSPLCFWLAVTFKYNCPKLFTTFVCNLYKVPYKFLTKAKFSRCFSLLLFLIYGWCNICLCSVTRFGLNVAFLEAGRWGLSNTGFFFKMNLWCAKTFTCFELDLSWFVSIQDLLWFELVSHCNSRDDMTCHVLQTSATYSSDKTSYTS